MTVSARASSSASTADRPAASTDHLAALWPKLDFQFLADDFVADYTQHATRIAPPVGKVGVQPTGRSRPGSRQPLPYLLWDPSQGQQLPPPGPGGREGFVSLGWDHGKLPLTLCEFLAYKSAVAYTDWPINVEDSDGVWPPGTLQRHLAESCAGASCAQAFSHRTALGDTQGYGFLYQGVAYIVMRGTAGTADWVTDLNDTLTSCFVAAKDGRLALTQEANEQGVKCTVLDPTDGTGPGNYGKLARVLRHEALIPAHVAAIGGSTNPPRHLGFALAWGVIRGQIDEWVQTLPRQEQHSFVFSGHSLGGALAFLGAHDFADRGRRIAAVITFGAPKVGDAAFQRDYDQRLQLKDRTFRLASNEDLVPLLARRSGYEHVGEPWDIRHRPRRTWWGMAKVGFGLWLFDALKFWKRTRSSDSTTSGKPAEAGASRVNLTSDATRNGNSDPAKQELAWYHRPWKELVLVILLFLVALIVRQAMVALAAHDMQKRYGLYLSTLAYNRFRTVRGKLHADDDDEDAAFEHAYHDIRRHLALIRGTDDALFKATRSGPVKVKSRQDLDAFLKKHGGDGGYFA